MEQSELKRTIEALLFVVDRPLTVDQIRDLTQAERKDIYDSLESIDRECVERKAGFRLKPLAGGYQFITDVSVSEVVKKYVQEREKRRLSQGSLETLSLIAYRQPITRAEIELVRGVNVDAAVRTLLEKGLIKPVGRKEVPGRPILYATTKGFLDHFGLSALVELPKLKEFTEKDIELPDHLKVEQTAAEVREGNCEEAGRHLESTEPSNE